MTEIRKPKTWDELPPVVWAEGEWFTTRLLEAQYRRLKAENVNLLEALHSLMSLHKEDIKEVSKGIGTKSRRLHHPTLATSTKPLRNFVPHLL